MTHGACTPSSDKDASSPRGWIADGAGPRGVAGMGSTPAAKNTLGSGIIHGQGASYSISTSLSASSHNASAGSGRTSHGSGVPYKSN
jgi:hypothetical protein